MVIHTPYVVTASAATQNYLKVVKAARGVKRPIMELNHLLVGYCSVLVDLHHKADPGIIVANNTAVAKYVSVENIWSLLTRV
jgi:hypothetical protein